MAKRVCYSAFLMVTEEKRLHNTQEKDLKISLQAHLSSKVRNMVRLWCLPSCCWMTKLKGRIMEQIQVQLHVSCISMINTFSVQMQETAEE